MKEEKKEIIIKKIEQTNNKYVAYYKSNILQSTYACCFTDNIRGAVALDKFHDMIRLCFEDDRINLRIAEDEIRFKSQALLDEFTKIESK